MKRCYASWPKYVGGGGGGGVEAVAVVGVKAITLPGVIYAPCNVNVRFIPNRN